MRHAILRVLAQEVERLRDPGLGFVTITDVTVTPDLHHATAFYTVYGEQVEVAATHDALRRATKHLRAVVAREVRLRYTPTLAFAQDPVPERASRIDSLIAELHRDREEQP